MSKMNKELLNKDYLEHYGILGMKWGQRKARIAEKKWEKHAQSRSTFVKVYNSAADRMNATEISRINRKPKYKNLDDPNVEKEYLQEYADTFTRILNEESSRIIGTSPSGRKVVVQEGVSGDIIFAFDDINHANDQIKFIGKRDSNGYITTIEFIDESLEQAENLVNNYLAHCAIFRMKTNNTKLKTAKKIIANIEILDVKLSNFNKG